MPASNDPKFIENLLLDILRRQDVSSDNLNEKIDNLETKMSDQHRILRDLMDRRTDDLTDQVQENTQKLAKHEHFFNVLTFLFTGGVAALASWGTWLQSFLPNIKSPHQ